jgi:hypothetical protein
MSWLFSQALVEEYSAANCSDGKQSAQWSVMPTPQGFWRNDKMMDASRLSQFGQTLQLLTEQDGEAVLTLFQAAFPAKTYQSQEQAQESQGSEADCGAKWHASFAKFSPDLSTWRIAQLSLLGGLELYSETWPRWGLMRDGECWEQQTVVHRISEKESGLWPTPTTQSNVQIQGQGAAASHPKRATTLAGAVKNWPTPTAHMAKETNAPSESKRNQPSLTSMVADTPDGRLNPQWVEWLMGWPIGWTGLKPLEMGRFQEWQQQHSESYQGSEAA